MSACPDWSLLLHGLIDGELDAANSIAIEAHLKTCAACAAELRQLEAVREAMRPDRLRYTAPDSLRARIEAGLSGTRMIAPSPQPAPGGRLRWAAGGLVTGLAASLAALVAVPQLTATGTEDELVASHVRSLLANHLTDIATSNRHVVKPWFNGRIDFAPPVVELADRGYPLVGGRLDYLDGKVVAAIVYRRRLHTINLFVRPAGALSLPIGVTARRDGYSLIRWTRGGLDYWAVSDIDPADLDGFRQAFVARTG